MQNKDMIIKRSRMIKFLIPIYFKFIEEKQNKENNYVKIKLIRITEN